MSVVVDGSAGCDFHSVEHFEFVLGVEGELVVLFPPLGVGVRQADVLRSAGEEVNDVGSVWEVGVVVGAWKVYLD